MRNCKQESDFYLILDPRIKLIWFDKSGASALDILYQTKQSKSQGTVKSWWGCRSTHRIYLAFTTFPTATVIYSKQHGVVNDPLGLFWYTKCVWKIKKMQHVIYLFPSMLCSCELWWRTLSTFQNDWVKKQKLWTSELWRTLGVRRVSDGLTTSSHVCQNEGLSCEN